ncbi:alpha/beta fold hydrolase [Streptomyces pactum]|uniref:Alpha/beta fold hydrolase n=1 Tax=Streptomyces pactum TaxID=68249 RepID=A0ABS0NIN3_9ACTN|nr:alpha/beta fold hydrolase [Streptomyces pactum]MBH5335045.1 alpha/beta fold hydrolase [Streptomyces pactum]
MATDRKDHPAGPPARSPLASAASALAVPLAPLYGAFLSYFVFHPPRKRHHKTPADVGIATSDEVVVPVGRKRRGIHLWLCPGDPGRVVVMGHGLGLSKSASLAQAALLHRAGYTVALFDHRNHGRSLTDRGCWNVSERHTDDVVAVVRHLRGLPEYAAARVAVYGFSISTFPSLYMLRRAEECPVDALLFDSGPAVDLQPLWRNFLASGALPVPGPLRGGPGGAVLGKVFAALAVRMLRASWPPPVTGAYRDTPLLFLTGERDTIIPADGVAALAARYPRAELRVLPDTGHLLGVKTHPREYEEAVLDFLGRALKG